MPKFKLLYFLCVANCVVATMGPGSSALTLRCRTSCDFLVERLDEHGLFAEVRSQITIGLRDGINGGIGKVAQDGGVPLSRGVAVINARYQQQPLGNR